MSYPLSNLGTVPPIFGDSPRQKGATKRRRTRSLPQKRSIVHTTKMHICDIFAIIASYHPKSRLNWGGFAKSRLNKRYLRELTWAGTCPRYFLSRGRDARAPSWRSSPGRGLSPVVTFYNFKNRLKPFYAVIAFSLLGPTSDCPRFFHARSSF